MKVDRQARHTAIYCRTERRRGNADALRHQKEYLVQYAQKHVIMPIEVYQDCGGGGPGERPAFQRLIKDIKADRVDTILVCNESRIDRNTRTLNWFLALANEHGCQVCTPIIEIKAFSFIPCTGKQRHKNIEIER